MGKTVAKTAGYSSALVERICAEIASGETMKAIVKMPDMPSEKTVYRWLAKYPEFVERYVLAHQLARHHAEQELIDLADAAPPTNEGAAKAKLQIWARQWVMGVRMPRHYGKQLTLAGDAERPLRAELSLEVVGVAAKKAG